MLMHLYCMARPISRLLCLVVARAGVAMLWFSIASISTLSTLYFVCLKIIQRDYIRKKADFFIFSFLMNLIQSIALLAMPPYRTLTFSRGSLLYGSLIGLLILANFFFTLQAFARGPLALTNSILGINMLVPIVYGLFFWDEKLTGTAIGGLVLFLVSIVFVSNAAYYEKDACKKTDIGWLVFALLSFAVSGVTMIISKHFAMILPAETRSYLLVYMWTNVLLSAIAYAALHQRSKPDRPQHPQITKIIRDGRYMLLCFIAGAAMAGANVFFMNAIGVSSSAFFFPATRGLGIIMMLIFSCFLFKERLSKKALTGFVLSGLAILMLSFS